MVTENTTPENSNPFKPKFQSAAKTIGNYVGLTLQNSMNQILSPEARMLYSYMKQKFNNKDEETEASSSNKSNNSSSINSRLAAGISELTTISSKSLENLSQINITLASSLNHQARMNQLLTNAVKRLDDIANKDFGGGNNQDSLLDNLKDIGKKGKKGLRLSGLGSLAGGGLGISSGIAAGTLAGIGGSALLAGRILDEKGKDDPTHRNWSLNRLWHSFSSTGDTLPDSKSIESESERLGKEFLKRNPKFQKNEVSIIPSKEEIKSSIAPSDSQAIQSLKSSAIASPKATSSYDIETSTFSINTKEFKINGINLDELLSSKSTFKSSGNNSSGINGTNISHQTAGTLIGSGANPSTNQSAGIYQAPNIDGQSMPTPNSQPRQMVKGMDVLQRGSGNSGKSSAGPSSGGRSGMGATSNKLGSLSAKYEGKVDSANPDNIGWAYGKYQFNSATGGLNKFFQDNPEYAKKFEGLTPGTAAFASKWREVAKNDKENFEAAQDNSAKKKWYDPAAEHAGKLGYKLDNRGIQEAIFSGSINHGGINSILSKAAATPGFSDMSPQDQIKAFYEARRNYVSSSTKIDDKSKQSLLKRYAQEEPNAIAYSKMKEGDTEERRDPKLTSKVFGKEGVIKQGGQSGNKDAVDALQPELKERLTALGIIHKDATGQALPINSANRTREDQERLWAGRHSNPNPVARPGTSKHEGGKAFDTNAELLDRYEKDGTLGKLGLYRPYGAKDPVHVEMRKNAGPLPADIKTRVAALTESAVRESTPEEKYGPGSGNPLLGNIRPKEVISNAGSEIAANSIRSQAAAESSKQTIIKEEKSSEKESSDRSTEDKRPSDAAPSRETLKEMFKDWAYE